MLPRFPLILALAALAVAAAATGERADACSPDCQRIAGSLTVHVPPLTQRITNPTVDPNSPTATAWADGSPTGFVTH